VEGGCPRAPAHQRLTEPLPSPPAVDHWSSFPTFAPKGHLLLWNNIDAPGQVSLVAQVLAGHNINIASLAVARQFEGGGSPALSVMVCDARIPSGAIKEMQALTGITNVRNASFE
jgi:hypothetical protein